MAHQTKFPGSTDFIHLCFRQGRSPGDRKGQILLDQRLLHRHVDQVQGRLGLQEVPPLREFGREGRHLDPVFDPRLRLGRTQLHGLCQNQELGQPLHLQRIPVHPGDGELGRLVLPGASDEEEQAHGEDTTSHEGVQEERCPEWM